jgi:catechol 2,3-dioxygenase-like lactoylglutathione lyase family enzyme
MRGLRWLAWVAALIVAVPLFAADDAGRVVGVAFTGRMVANLDQSVAFYSAIGFERDATVSSAWSGDEAIRKLYGAPGIETRAAKMSVNSNVSGGKFVVYLREIRGIERNNLSMHAAWEPGATHFGIVVPDAHALWAKLQQAAMLRARSWGEALVAPPGVTPGQMAYVTDPDGIDVEIINQSPAIPASDGKPAQAAVPPGINHVGMIVLDSDKAQAFYGELFGGVWQARDAPWMQGDFFDSAVGGHGNVLRFFNLAFPEAYAPDKRLNLELVEFQNRKKPLLHRNITDIGAAYFGFEVKNLDAFLPRALAAGATPVGDKSIVKMSSGTREIMLRDPDTGAFVLLFEAAK